MGKTTPEKIVEKLKDNLQKVDRNESCDLLYVERAVGICSLSLSEQHSWVNQFDFTDKNNEIYFLNPIKHCALSEFHFYFKLFEVRASHFIAIIKARKDI